MTAAGPVYASERSNPPPNAHARRARVLTRTGFGSAVVTKVADAGTTWVGVTTIPGIVERNPVAADVMSRLGPAPGLVLLSVVALVVTVIGVESIRRSVTRLRLRGYHAARWLWVAPAAAYLGVAIVWGSAAVRNLLLLIGSGTFG